MIMDASVANLTVHYLTGAKLLWSRHSNCFYQYIWNSSKGASRTWSHPADGH